MNLRGSLLRSNHGPRTALGRDGRIASALAEGRPLLNGRTHLGTIRPSPFILPSSDLSPAVTPLPIPRLGPSPWQPPRRGGGATHGTLGQRPGRCSASG